MTTPAVHSEVGNFDNDPAVDRMNAGIAASGLEVDEAKIVDTWGFNYMETFAIDGVQEIYFQRMNEGMKSEYQKKTNRDIRVQRSTGDAKLKVDPATDRAELIKISVKDWKLYRYVPKAGAPGGRQLVEVKFSLGELVKWMEQADPKIIQDLEKKIRDANPWMAAEASLENLKEERDNLDERIKKLEEEERNKS